MKMFYRNLHMKKLCQNIWGALKFCKYFSKVFPITVDWIRNNAFANALKWNLESVDMH